MMNVEMNSLSKIFSRKAKANPKSKESNSSSYLKALLIYNPAITAVALIVFGGLHNFWSSFAISLTIAITVTNTVYIFTWALRYFEIAYYKKQKMEIQESSRRRTHAVVILALLPGLYWGFQLAGEVAKSLKIPFEAPDLSSYVISLSISLGIFFVFVLYDFWKDAKTAKQSIELRIKRLENDRLHAQLSALNAQMNPHLLFNALNTIASMIQSDPNGAEEVTVKLSELYRGILDSSRKMSHTLAEELKICGNYLSIEQFRFGDRLNTKFEIHSSIDTDQIEIPALLLQPLIENAVKHGISPRAKAGTVIVAINQLKNQLRILIADDGVGFGKSASSGGAKSGIANCKSRIELKYGANGSLEIRERSGGGTEIEIMIPNKKVSAS